MDGLGEKKEGQKRKKKRKSLSFSERIIEQIRISDNKKREYSEVLMLSWRHVFFFNGYIALYHPDNPKDMRPFLYILPASKKAYNQIQPVFIDRLPKIKVEAENRRIVNVLEIPDLTSCIEVITKKSAETKMVRKQKEIRKSLHKASNAEIIEYIKEKNSAYLDYLCEKQLPGQRIYYNQERAAHSNNASDEDAFLFIIGKNETEYMLVYENILPSRSTLMLHVHQDGLEEAIDEVSTFFASAEINKREQLAQNSIEFESKYITWTVRVLHTSFAEWKTNLRTYEKQLY